MFNSVESMVNFKTAKEGDMALVADIQPVQYAQADEVVTKIIFPKTVYIGETVTSEYCPQFITYVSKPSRISYFSSSIQLNAREVDLQIRMTQGTMQTRLDIRYTGNNGVYTMNYIHYSAPKPSILVTSLGTLEDNVFTFTENMQISSSFGGNLVKFLVTADDSNLIGLYTYKSNNFIGTSTQFNATTESVFNLSYMGKNGAVETGTLQQVTNLNTEQIRLRRNIRNMYNILGAGDDYYIGFYRNNGVINNFDLRTDNKLADLDVSNIHSAVNMFNNCGNLVSINGLRYVS